MTLFIPSPSISSFQIGPLTIHFYALCLVTGIIVAWTIGLRRWKGRGGQQESFEKILLWAIPLGVVGARAHHVLTRLGDYFAPGINPWSALFIWEGGIAIYGAIGAGALVAWLVTPQGEGRLRSVRRRTRPRDRHRSGLRALRQLVQPGAVRHADRPALGAGD